jgi:GR25 family glycosyltransferase involved in LPS biosynthesis
MDLLSRIDGVFVVSLKHRKDRRELAKKEFDKAGIGFAFYDGIHHKEGFVGLNHTMLSLFRYCVERNYEYVWVNEDDVVLCEMFLEKMQGVAKQIDKNFDCLHFGVNLLMPPVRYSNDLLKITTAYAAHSVIYSRTTMERLITLIEEHGTCVSQNQKPFDVILAEYIQPDGNCYCTSETLAKQRPSKSDIFKPDNSNLGFVSKYYNNETQVIDWQKMMDERFVLLKPK